MRPILALLILSSAATVLAQDISVSVTDISATVPNPSENSLLQDGENATLSITLTNLGPSAASNIMISNTFSGPATFVSATPTAGSCSGTGPIVCTIPSLSSGGVEGITIVLKTTGVGTLTDTASLTGSAPADPNSANNSGTVQLTVSPGVQLKMVLSCTPAGQCARCTEPRPTIPPGQIVQCTAVGQNIGPDADTGVFIQGGAANMAGIATSSNPAFTCTTTATDFKCSDTSNSFASGETASISFAVRAPAQETTIWGVQASISGLLPQLNVFSLQQADTMSYTVSSATGDVGVEVSAGGPIVAGQNATFTIRVTNHGSADAQGVSVGGVLAALPGGLTFVSNSGACTTPFPFPCNIGTLAAGASATITSRYSVAASATGSGSITAQVSTTSPDSNASNDSSTLPYTISTSADLSVTSTLSGALTPGEAARYVTTIRNSGPSDARDVSVSNPTPAAMSFVSNSGGCATAFPCNLGTIAAGSSAVITSTYSVAPSATGTVSTMVQVSSSTPDPSASNNSAMTSNAISTTTRALAAHFTWTPLLPSVGETVQFIDTSTGSPTIWLWDFGDGSQATTRDPAHMFASPGAYNVSLTASNATASSRKVSLVVIGGSASSPSAGFFWSPSPAIAGQTISFFDQSTGTPTSWSWMFGNGETSHDQNPRISYATQGAYVVTLTATNDLGVSSISQLVPVVASVAGECPALTEQNVDVAHHGLTSGCGQSEAACFVNETIEFAAVYPACGSLSLTWSFGDGSPTSTLSSPVHQYTSSGDYVVTVIVANGISSVVLIEPIRIDAPDSTSPRRRTVHH